MMNRWDSPSIQIAFIIIYWFKSYLFTIKGIFIR